MASTYSIDEIMSEFEFTQADIAKVKNGEVVNSGVATLTDRDLATMIAFEAKGISDSFERVFLESPTKQQADSTIQQMMASDADGELDFSSLEILPKESAAAMVKTYLTFNGGSDLNLSHKEIDMFHALGNHASQKQVEEVLQKVLAGRVQEYKQGGLEAISPYLRGKGKDFFPGKELQEKSEKSPYVKKFKEFADYIMGWPSSAKLDGLQEGYQWINYNINNKPSIALQHKVIWADKKRNVKFIFNRTFYVSQGHNSVQQAGIAVPTGDKSALLMFVSRTSTDAVSGFGGAAKRAMGSRLMGGKIAENMAAIRDTLTK